MPQHSMNKLRNAILFEEKLMSKLRETLVEIDESYDFTNDIKEEVVEKLKKLEADSLYHEEILNYWVEQINAGAKI